MVIRLKCVEMVEIIKQSTFSQKSLQSTSQWFQIHRPTWYEKFGLYFKNNYYRILIGNNILHLMVPFLWLKTLNHPQWKQPTTILRLSVLCPGKPGWAGTRRNIYPLTPIVVINHTLSASSIFCDPWHHPRSMYVPHSLLPQPLYQFSMVYLGLAPSTSYSIHSFTQSMSSFHKTCPYHCNLYCCSTEIMSSNPRLSLNPLLGTLSCTLTPHIHLNILISDHWCATSFSSLTGQVPLPCNILLRTQLLHNLLVTINGNDISLEYIIDSDREIVHPYW